MKYAGQILNQAAEVHSSVCRKVKQHLRLVEGVLRVHHFHFEFVLAHLLAAYLQRLLLPGLKRLDLLLILRRRLAQDRAQRLLNEGLIHHLHAG